MQTHIPIFLRPVQKDHVLATNSENFREQAGVAGEIRMSNDEGITKFETRF
jgi:hypothetical protein